MYVTGMEVTQGIQNLSNSVLLVKSKRTFVRVYVKSAGPSGFRRDAPSWLLPTSRQITRLQPVNPVGTKITVRTNPNRNDINQSFLFELPWSWTQDGQPATCASSSTPTRCRWSPITATTQHQPTVSFQNSPTPVGRVLPPELHHRRHDLQPAHL